MRDIIIVGGGIIGTTVAKVFRNSGYDALLLDDRRPMSGSAASGGHLKESWFGIPKEVYEPALDLLDVTWGLNGEDFLDVRNGKNTVVYRVNTDEVLKYPFTQGKVTSVSPLRGFPSVKSTVGDEQGRMLLVAAGVWCHELLPAYKTTPKQGVSFRVRGTVHQPFIDTWAPYKQIVAHQQAENEMWIGDGSTILQRNWTDQHTTNSRDRCLKALEGPRPTDITRTIHGLRPYTQHNPDEPCLFEQIGPNAYVATGAGKSGTISAGFVARRLLDAFKR